MGSNHARPPAVALRKIRAQLIVGTIFLALSLALFEAPGWMEGPSLWHLSPGRGISVSDVLALLPLAIGVTFIVIPLWRQRPFVGRQLNTLLAAGGAEVFCAGIGIGLVVAKGFTALNWDWPFSLIVAASPLLVPLAMLLRND